MDKIERAKIIAVKLEEVLHDNAMEAHLRRQEETKRMLEHPDIKKILKQYDANRKALNTMADDLKKVVDGLNTTLEKRKTLDQTTAKMHVKTGVDSYPYKVDEPSVYITYTTKRNGWEETVSNCAPNKPIIPHSEVMTQLTRHRNSNNPRVRLVVNEAFHLLLEDDAERMTKFLDL
jgi:hypothetical protein